MIGQSWIEHVGNEVLVVDVLRVSFAEEKDLPFDLQKLVRLKLITFHLKVFFNLLIACGATLFDLLPCEAVVTVHFEIRIHLEVMDHDLEVHEDSTGHPYVPATHTLIVKKDTFRNNRREEGGCPQRGIAQKETQVFREASTERP